MVRTRFAPSPTGYMHIGNLRTALYAYCFARHHHGAFLLRIEDTDRKRNMAKTVQVIYDSLRLAGLEYDEGPGKEGGCGPYVQSQRKELGIYQTYADLLVERGAAYRCFCQKPEGRSESRLRAGMNPCRSLSAVEAQARARAGEAFVIRQRIPEVGTTTFEDLNFGAITVKNSTLDDQILLKSDGFPTYNFANVVDDHLMEISHVFRGVEYLSSTPKYNLLYQGFGWEIPVYVHLPHIIKENGKKLSKREGDASFQDLTAKGYLPQAVINCIALLGWNPGGDREFFDLPGLVAEFDARRIGKSRAAFSLPKLQWLNGEHTRRLPAEEFHRLAEPFYPEALSRHCDTRLVSQMVQPRVVVLGDLPQMTGFLLQPAPYSAGLFEHAKSKSTLESSARVLREALPFLQGLDSWTEETVRLALMDYAAGASLKTGTVMWPVRAALSGLVMTPGGATELAAVLGKEEALSRLARAAQWISAGGESAV
jgi:glutamyl-tRNA synthetase